MREGGGPGQQRLDAPVEMRVALEIRNAHRAVEQGAGDRVLHAELGLERSLRAGIVGVRQAAAVRHDLDLRHVVSADAFFLAEREHHSDGRVGAAAAGKLLEAHGLAGDLQRVDPVVEDLVGVIVAGAVKGVEEPLLVLEHGRVGIVAGSASRMASRPLRADWPTCRGLTMVPKLAFTPEAKEAAMARATVSRSSSRPTRCPTAAAAPKTPIVAVGCQPLS